MSAPAPNLGGQERQNRKILEQLEEQKKRLRTQTSAQPLPKEFPVANHTAVPQILTSSIDIQMTQAQRTAIQHAHANSVGYFTTQDSAFGNLILPVLPRFDK